MNNTRILSDITWFKKILTSSSLRARIERIKLIVLDVDGCLTDAQIFLPEHGEEIKGFSVQDGLGISMAIKQGLSVAFLSGRGSKKILERAISLGIPASRCALNVDDKITKLHALQKECGVLPQETLYVGDDLIDLVVRPAVGIFACPANAPFYIQPQADIVIDKCGGFGAVRLMLDLVLYVQNKHDAQTIIAQAIN